MLSLSLFIASFIYVISPGPAFLTVMTLTAKQGRKAGALFVTGHLVGDILWAALSLAAIIGISVLGKSIFMVLGVICGGYLIFLGFKATLYPSQWAEQKFDDKAILQAGAFFGLTNPKAYPVALAMFTSFVGDAALSLTWEDLPFVFIVSLFGFIAADLILIFIAGLTFLRTFFLKNQINVTRGVGITFILFGLKVIVDLFL